MAFPIEVRRQIAYDNLHMQEKDIAATLEARRSHLSDIVSILLSDETAPMGIVEMLRKVGTDAFFTERDEIQLHREVREENRTRLAASLGALSSYDHAVIAELTETYLSHEKNGVSPACFFAPRGVYDRIAYVKNAYTDEAYDAFAEELKSPTALYCDRYEEACAEVTNGAAGYCILPLRDTTGAYHRATLVYLMAHALMVVATVTVTDGEDVPMQYALCGTAPLDFPRTWECCISFSGEWQVRMGEICTCAEYFGFHLNGLQHDVDGREVLATICGEGNITPLLIWMHLFAPTCRIIGYYSKTEEF